MSTETQLKRNILKLKLSENLFLTTTTVKEPTVTSTSNQLHTNIHLVKEEYKQLGEHRVIRKAIIQLTSDKYSLLKASINSIDSFICFAKAYADHQQECQTPVCRNWKLNWTSPIWRYQYHIPNPLNWAALTTQGFRNTSLRIWWQKKATSSTLCTSLPTIKRATNTQLCLSLALGWIHGSFIPRSN